MKLGSGKNRFYLLISIFLFIGGFASVPAYGGTPTYNGDFAASNTSTMAFNQTAGTDRILIVRALYENGLANPFVPFATYNTLPMTLLRSDNAAGLAAHVFYLINPPVGNFNVQITGGGAARQRIEAFSYSGVDQTTPIGNHNGATGNDAGAPYVSTVPFTPTSTASRVVILDWWQGNAGGTGYTPSHGTARNSGALAMWQWHHSGFSDWNPPSTAGVSLTQTWSAGGTQWTSQAFELMPALPPAGPITLTKSSNVTTIAVGETLTYCLAWSNGDNTANPIVIWDTVPSVMNYQGCNTGCTFSGGLVNWNLGSQAAFSSGSVCFWGVITGVP